MNQQEVDQKIQAQITPLYPTNQETPSAPYRPDSENSSNSESDNDNYRPEGKIKIAYILIIVVVMIAIFLFVVGSWLGYFDLKKVFSIE